MRKQPRPYHHGDLKRALIEASLELVQERGVEALTVAEVGRRLGVSTAAPYKHFTDRRALLRALAAEANRRLEAAIHEAVGDTAEREEAFRRSGVAYIRWAAENPALFQLLADPELLAYDEPPPDSHAPGPLRGTMESFWSDLARLLRSGEAIPAGHPLVQQLRGRAVAHGVASLFVSGVFDALGVGRAEAERIARAVTGEDVPARGAAAKSTAGG